MRCRARLSDGGMTFHEGYIGRTEDGSGEPFGDALPGPEQTLDFLAEVVIAFALAVEERSTCRGRRIYRSFINGANSVQALGSHAQTARAI